MNEWTAIIGVVARVIPPKGVPVTKPQENDSSITFKTPDIDMERFRVE